MNVELIKMPKEEAHKKIEAFKKRLGKIKGAKVASDINKEYQACLAGYEALARGTPLLDLEDVFRDCPCDTSGRPKLAISRADKKQVQFCWDAGQQTIGFFDAEKSRWNCPHSMQRNVNMARTNGTKYLGTDNRYYEKNLIGFSIVPIVPADIRPKIGKLEDMYILWEVEKWADSKIRAIPDRDPYLLKHIGGSLYAVLAEWDLTDLERSIMKGRLS